MNLRKLQSLLQGLIFIIIMINFYNYNDSIHHNFMCVSGGVVLIPGLCYLSFYLLAIHN